MIKVLIPTKPDDIHALSVCLALQKKGHQGVLWHTADFPIQQFHSFELLDREVAWHAHGPNFKIENDTFNVVWRRRPEKPTIADSVHPDDRENAERESLMLFHTFWRVIAPNARWINPEVNAKMANSKLLQLKLAIEVGLSAPKTLISNDPEKIKKFAARCKNKLIYKTMYPLYWFKVNDIRMSYTREFNIDQFSSDAVLKMMPGIFQEKVQKAYELRVTYFGNFPVAVKLRSQEHPRGIMDWRYIPPKELAAERYTLPNEIDQKCQALMKKLGLVFGCFDFIVTPDQQYYFLEVNESGQFLWIEGINPEIKMLDIFTTFLINKNKTFNWSEQPDTISAHDFEKEMQEMLDTTLKSHVNPNLYPIKE